MPGSDLCEYSILHIDVRHYTYYSGTLSSWLDIPGEKALNRLKGNANEKGYYQECEERLGIMTEYTEKFYREVHKICEKLIFVKNCTLTTILFLDFTAPETNMQAHIAKNNKLDRIKTPHSICLSRNI